MDESKKITDMIPHKITQYRGTHTHGHSKSTIIPRNYNSKFKIGLPLRNDGKEKPGVNYL